MITEKPPLANELAAQFRVDAETIAQSLLDWCGLTHSKSVQELDQAILRWLDFRLRFVDPKPRPLVYSNLLSKPLSDEVRQALADFEQISLAGGDLNPFQGKGLTMHHDTSGAKRQNRTDHLWAEWNIHHFHLAKPSQTPGQYYSERSRRPGRPCWLLFAVIFDNAIACIDITDHGKGAMENRSLIEAFIRDWPDAAEHFRLKGILPPTSQLPAEDIKKSRVAGFSSFVMVDDKVYVPGGITRASTSERVTLALNQISRETNAIAQLAIGEVVRDRGEFGSADLSHLSLALTPRGLGIFDDRGNKCWPLPRAKGDWANHPAARWHDLMIPEWLEAKIAEAWTHSNA